jgi:hypothetical protein
LRFFFLIVAVCLVQLSLQDALEGAMMTLAAMANPVSSFRDEFQKVSVAVFWCLVVLLLLLLCVMMGSDCW